MPRAGRAKSPEALVGEVLEEHRRAAQASDGHLPELLPVLD
jgi:FO synthase